MVWAGQSLNGAAALEARELEAGYGPRPVLQNLNLTLEAGRLTGVIGPNGSGKSTLLKALSGRLPAARGAVYLEGRPLAEMGARERAQRLAVVPVATPPVFGFSVADVAAQGGYARTAARETAARVAAALELLELTAAREAGVTSLSSGEWQRVLLARALVQDAPVLLLDEPTAHLDVKHQHRVFELLLRLALTERKAILCVCHDLNLASEYCGRLLLLSQGRIAAAGEPGEVVRGEVLAPAYGLEPFISAHPRSGLPVVLPARQGSGGG